MATTAKIAKEQKKPKFKVRLRNRCHLCGRPRAYMRKFALCRLCFRKLALEGDITGVERISRPGRRVYFGRDDVPEVLAGLGTSILTTSRGVMTGREAVKAGVGGEVLCNIW